MNSTIADAAAGAKFLSCDLKDFFLASPMTQAKCMKVALKYFLEDIIKRYNLIALENNGYVFVEINKVMYGLKQAAILAYAQLYTYLREAEYPQVLGSTGMWKHVTIRTVFCLYVDDCGIKLLRIRR